MTTFETAQQFYLMKIGVFPVRPREKKPAVAHWQPYQTRLPTPSDILSWWGADSDNNLGVVGGWQGLTVIDFDDQQVYRKWRRWASGQGGAARRVATFGYQVGTSRGVHVYVRLATAERNRHMPGIDIKSRGGYVLGEGSVHPDGPRYTNLTPGMVILRADALSDLLPVGVLTVAQDLPPNVANAPLFSVRRPAGTSDDPWEVASQIQPAPGAGVVEAIKRRLVLTDLVADSEPTSRDGRWRIARCPLHDDQHPSLWLDLASGLCGCYAGCTPKPLDVIGLYARITGLTNHEAILALAKLL